MTPTDRGEAPYAFRAVSAATATPPVMGGPVAGDPSLIAPRLRDIALNLDPGLRLDEVRSLDDLAWRVDVHACSATSSLGRSYSVEAASPPATACTCCS